jgi:predicted dehydrogenase
MAALRVGIIGYGYWGPNLTRNFYELPEAELVAIADSNQERLKQAQIKYTHVVVKHDYHELFDLNLDAVVVATPPASHYRITKECLEHILLFMK